MTLFARSSLEERLHTEREIGADASARFIRDLATMGVPMPLAGIKAAGDAAQNARNVTPLTRLSPAMLIVTTPAGPCAPAI